MSNKSTKRLSDGSRGRKLIRYRRASEQTLRKTSRFARRLANTLSIATLRTLCLVSRPLQLRDRPCLRNTIERTLGEDITQVAPYLKLAATQAFEKKRESLRRSRGGRPGPSLQRMIESRDKAVALRVSLSPSEKTPGLFATTPEKARTK